MTEDSFAEQSAKLLQAFDFAAEMTAREREYQEQLQDLLLSLLDVMGAFDRFLTGVESVDKPTAEQVATWLNTFRLIARQMERTLQEAGLTPTACLGQVVDPQRHEIVEVEEMDGIEDDVIIQVVSRGYEWNGQLLRRPQVVVARNVDVDKEGG